MDEVLQVQMREGAEAPVPVHPPRRARPDVKIDMLRDDARLRLWRHAGKSDRLVVCFSGVGRNGKQPPRLEFAKTASAAGRDHALYFADPARSWLNAPGLIEEIVEIIEAEVARLGVREVVAMGHSLGGFSALVLSGFTRFDRVLALSPQLSVDPDIVPDERRWAQFRARIEAIRVHQAGDHMAAQTQHCIIYGRNRREAPQLRLLKPAENVQAFLLPKVQHDSVKRLYDEGILDDVVQLALGGRVRKLRQLLKARMRAVQIGPEMEGEAA